MPRPRLSLKARALGWLAQREHSRSELRRKLLRVARAEAAERLAERGEPAAEETLRAPDEPPPMQVPTQAPMQARIPAQMQPEMQPQEAESCEACEAWVDKLLDWLQEHRYLSEARFVESRVNARAVRYGNLRIRQELAQHGVTPDEATLLQLRQSELERAREVWRRKFGAVAPDAKEKARQMRFLAQRGFSSEVVRRVIGGEEDEG